MQLFMLLRRFYLFDRFEDLKMLPTNFNLPRLPGYSFSSNVGREYFGKKQHFTYMNNTCVMSHEPQYFNTDLNLFSRGSKPDLPSWLFFDKQILTFDAIFQSETLNSTPVNRLVKIMFFLEDNTMKVVEPKTKNSGLYQGTIVRRQRIPLPDDNNNYYDVIHLNIGREIEIYGKTYLLVNCDKFTRSFLSKVGLRIPEPLCIPEQTNYQYQMQPNRSFFHKERRTSVQFLEYDRKVLRFYGYWDDKNSENGSYHNLEILYFLADDTMEIREITLLKPSIEKFSVFLKRGPLPKELQTCLVAKHGIPIDSYKPDDLSIGMTLDVYGRAVVLTDCDNFTKEYYHSKYGLEFDSSTDTAKPLIDFYPKKKIARELPPWNGYGSHKDSANSCDTLEPKILSYDFFKFLKKDGTWDESHILRFGARFLSDIPDNTCRRFILSYYLKDDTISVFELPIRNLGFRGGMFFKRNSVVVPGQNLFIPTPPVCYTTKNIWIGNILTINDHRFLLINADEYSLKYMEEHTDEFEKSNIALIMEKINNRLKSKENGFKDFVAKNMLHTYSENKNLMSLRLFESALKEIAGDCLSEHEFITIVRFFEEKRPEPEMNKEYLRSLVHSELKRYFWEDNVRLLEHFQHLDKGGSGVLSYKMVRQALIANRLPISRTLLDNMLNVISKNDDNEVKYMDVMDFIDFKLRPPQILIAIPAKSTKQIQKFSPTDIPTVSALKDAIINWDKFINYFNCEHLVTEKI